MKDAVLGTLTKVTLSEKELEEFRRNRILVEKPEKAQRLNVSALDPTIFNIEQHHSSIELFSAEDVPANGSALHPVN